MKSCQIFCFVVIAFCIADSMSFKLGKTSVRASCPPKPPTVSELDTQKYLGEWYQQQGLPAFFQPSGTRCIKATYGLNDDGTISVKNNEVNSDGSYRDICGYADTPDPAFPGQLQVHFGGFPTGDYWLLDTDYENYASVYSCSDVLGLFKFEYAWLLVRTRTPSEEVIAKGLDAYTRNGISLDGFEIIDQGDSCIYSHPEGQDCDK